MFVAVAFSVTTISDRFSGRLGKSLQIKKRLTVDGQMNTEQRELGTSHCFLANGCSCQIGPNCKQDSQSTKLLKFTLHFHLSMIRVEHDDVHSVWPVDSSSQSKEKTQRKIALLQPKKISKCLCGRTKGQQQDKSGENQAKRQKTQLAVQTSGSGSSSSS